MERFEKYRPADICSVKVEAIINNLLNSDNLEAKKAAVSTLYESTSSDFGKDLFGSDIKESSQGGLIRASFVRGIIEGACSKKSERESLIEYLHKLTQQ